MELNERVLRIKNQQGQTALHLATQCMHVTTVELLRKYDDGSIICNEAAAFTNLVDKLVNEPADNKIRVPGARPDKVQIFSVKKYNRSTLLEEAKERKDWLLSVQVKREVALRMKALSLERRN